jgi:hypothetical protein
MSQEVSPNQWADFWYYNNGVNVIPAHNLTKKPKVEWKEWQTMPIPEELFKEWKPVEEATSQLDWLEF